jgi:hypothetical protein
MTTPANHIDLGSVLRQTLAANLYSNLVTRPTGRAVRTQIELLLKDADRTLTVIDFSHVQMIDFSCADEVIAKLMLGLQAERETYFVVRGMTDDHWHAIEQVLEHHGLAIVVERGDGVDLLGVLDDIECRAWQALKRRGRASSRQLAADLDAPEPDARATLERMWRRRLIARREEQFMPVSALS